MTAIENIPGSFYLGKKFDLENRQLLDDVVQYRSKDLTTHALCVGMTGSGKTGLCISLIEEAALDGIPVLCIDPKGDLGNLLLTFPDLQAKDFEPWIDRETTPDVFAAAENVASVWRKGLESWRYDRTYLEQLQSVEKIIYTPGSSVGVPLTVLKSLDAPGEAVLQDPEILRDQISSSVSGLLALLGIDADPLTSREHILLSNILAKNWQDGRDLSMEDLIRSIQTPPIQKIGVLDVESFFPKAERIKLSMMLNNLLASPSFAGWLQGQSLHIQDLLYDKQGKAKISILSIAHLNDSERMFFVTILLNEMISWMRTQRGTSALRAILYMDEIYGYFPPNSKPPSKGPMMTLLKQARAFGLGVVLATQNPVDLDYKGLSNMGTWFLGRLQTQRDKDRVLEGLQGASLQRGAAFDRASMDRMLSAVGNRVFLMNNVNDPAPTIFQTRFALSYLRGPLSRDEISKLMANARRDVLRPETSTSQPSAQDRGATSNAPAATSSTSGRPIVSAGIEERFLEADQAVPKGSQAILKPALLGSASVHFVRAAGNIDIWKDFWLLAPSDRSVSEHPWDQSIAINPDDLQISREPLEGFTFAELPPELLLAKNYKAWDRELAEFLFRHEKMNLYTCKAIRKNATPGKDEFSARLELAEFAREARDEAMDRVRAKYDERITTFEMKVAAAQQRLDRSIEEAKAKRLDGLVNLGTSILGSLLGGRRRSVPSSAVRDLTGSSQNNDVSRAQETLESLVLQKNAMERECTQELDAIESQYSIENLKLEESEIPIRKSDTKIKLLALAWVPYAVDAQGNERMLLKLR
ncbi:MAG: ATP-binding protein [Planctomycetota bacterium]|jgi:hypothetical protein